LIIYLLCCYDNRAYRPTTHKSVKTYTGIKNTKTSQKAKKG